MSTTPSKITFKRHDPVGRYRSFDHACTDIKRNKREIGTIHEIDFSTWKVRFMVQKEGQSAPWVWRQVNVAFPDEAAARAFVVANVDKLEASVGKFYEMEP